MKPWIPTYCRLSDLQQECSRLAAKNLERSTHLKNVKEISMEKKLLISNIKLGILNMYEYVISKAVFLPGDKKARNEEASNKV